MPWLKKVAVSASSYACWTGFVLVALIASYCGDRDAPADQRVLNSPVAIGAFRGGGGPGAAMPLPASGLLGPVTLLRQIDP